MSKLRNKLKGFTLIELMIVVAIIGILAAIAIPNFIRYQLRSKTSEVRTNIGGIKTSEESFRATEDNYAPVAATPSATARSTKQSFGGTAACPANCNRQSPTNCTAWTCIGFLPAGDVYYNYATSVVLGAAGTTPEYAVGGNADLDADGSAGSFSYQTANKVGGTAGVTADGLSACSAGQPPSEVVDCVPGVF